MDLGIIDASNGVDVARGMRQGSLSCCSTGVSRQRCSQVDGDKTWPLPFLLTITSCRRPSDLEREGP